MMKRQFSAIESRMSAEKQVPADAAIEVDIIIPVHNAAETIRETVKSALGQVGSKCLSKRLTIYVCCYDDGSTDDSLTILRELKVTHENQTEPSSHESYSDPLRQSFVSLSRSMSSLTRYEKWRIGIFRPISRFM